MQELPRVISPKKPTRVFTAPVLQLQVIDGDTLKMLLDTGFGGREEPTCRLLGLDAPEKSTRAGILVRRLTHEWCRERIVTLEWDSEEVDKYGRSLGDLTSGQESLSSYLFHRLLVKHYNGEGKRVWEQEELDAVESAARDYLLMKGINANEC